MKGTYSDDGKYYSIPNYAKKRLVKNRSGNDITKQLKQFIRWKLIAPPQSYKLTNKGVQKIDEDKITISKITLKVAKQYGFNTRKSFYEFLRLYKITTFKNLTEKLAEQMNIKNYLEKLKQQSITKLSENNLKSKLGMIQTKYNVNFPDLITSGNFKGLNDVFKSLIKHRNRFFRHIIESKRP